MRLGSKAGMCQARSVIFPDYRIFLFPRHHTRQMGKVFPITPPTPQNKARRCDDIRNIELYLGRFGVDRSTLDFVAGLCRSPRAIPTVGRRLQNVDDFFRRTWFSYRFGSFARNRFVKPQIMGENGDNFLRRLFPCHVMRFFPRCVHDRFRDQSSARGRPRWFRRWFHRCFVIFGSLFDSLVGLHEQPEDA